MSPRYPGGPRPPLRIPNQVTVFLISEMPNAKKHLAGKGKLICILKTAGLKNCIDDIDI